MKFKNSIKAAVGAAALTVSISGARAQYVVPPVVSGTATVLPYGGYYGPSFTISPTVTVGAPFYSQSMGLYGYGGYGYSNYDANGYGYGNYGFTGYNPFAVTTIGDIYGGSPGDRTVNPIEVQGGVVNATNPNAISTPNNGDATSAATANQQSRSRAAATQSPVAIRRAPYNRVDITYRGNTSNVDSITMMLLDRRGRQVQQVVLTNPPAETQLRRPVGARYYRVIVSFIDGTNRTYTHTLVSK